MRPKLVYHSSAPLRYAGMQNGSVAQLVEQRIENPRVGGSIPSRAIIFLPGYLD